MRSQQTQAGHGRILHGDVLQRVGDCEDGAFQAIIADPPYYQVLVSEEWDTQWTSPDAYVDWTVEWARACRPKLKSDGLLFVFGQPGKREHVWLHVCSALSREMQFHDLIIWDRAVGYNERSDSFTPQYEMILVLRQAQDVSPYFDKDAVRVPYDEKTIAVYLKDKRYKNSAAREEHLRKGKYATNLMRVPSLKGASKEKIGHPSQKPLALIRNLILASTRPGDVVLDPFLGSGTTAHVAELEGRGWVGIECDLNYVKMASDRIQRIAGAAEK